MAYECTEYCEQKRSSCRTDCDDFDLNCSFECDYNSIACANSCPCFENCPLGCQDCQTSFCVCHDYENHEDYVECLAYYEDVFTLCTGICSETGFDMECVMQCYRDYEGNVETCPCQSRCPDGCPCPFYDCPTPEPTPSPHPTGNSVLILSTGDSWKPPVITDGSGRSDSNFFFRFQENTSVYGGCTVTFQNQAYIFGGSDSASRRQVSKVEGCQLERVGTLAFDHALGACANVNNTRVYLCFSDAADDSQRCRYTTQPLSTDYTNASSSVYGHRKTSIASSQSKNKVECYHNLAVSTFISSFILTL